MHIHFEKHVEEVTFYSPLAGMERVTGEIERREDPLTGRTAIFSTLLGGKKEILFPPTDWEHLKKAAEQSRPNCFFCPGKVEEATPKYQEDWLPEGRLRVGECLLFPNLFPVAAVHAVIVLGKKHFRMLDDFPAGLLRDGLDAGIRFVRSVYENDPAKRHFSLSTNYLPPAGASLIHPHLQLLGGSFPSFASSEIMGACRRFKEEQGADYFELLAKQEKERGERYAGATGAVQWLTPFAPMGTCEVLGVLPGYADLLRLDDDALCGLAEGLHQVLRCYLKLGFCSFNFTLYSAPFDEEEVPHPPFIRVICRQNVYLDYRADDYFVQKLLGEELIIHSPEELAAELRTFMDRG